MAENWMLKAVLSANADGMVKALTDVGKMAKTTRKYISDVATSSGKLGKSLGLPVAALSAVMGGFSLMAVKNAVVGFAEMGETVERGAIKAGMSVQQWQRMKYVADQSGTSIETMENSLSKLNRTVGDAAAGKNQNLAGLMKKLGINTRDANGHVRAGIDLLPELADAFKKNENPAVRARMGMALFGKTYAEILPMLAEGSEGIDSSLKRFDKLKGVMGPEEIRGAKALGDSFKDLNMVLKGFQMTIAKELAPVIKPLVDGLTEWWVANKKLVGTEVGKMAKDLGAWIKTIDFKAVVAGVNDFFRGLGKLVDALGGAKNALIALVIFMNMNSIMAVVGLIGSIARLVIGLGGLALSALAPIAPLQALSTEMAATNAAGGKMVGMMGRLGAAAAVAAAAFAGWEVGGWINKKFVEGTSFGDKLGSGIAHTMAFFGNQDAQDAIATRNAYNARKPITASPRGNAWPDNASRKSLMLSNQVQASGQINISFADAPPGMRVDQGKTMGNLPIDVGVGYRSYSTGMPY